MEYKKVKELPPNPLERFKFFSYMCFCWVLPVFFKGRKRELDSSDMYRVLGSHKSSTLGQSISDAWERQIFNHKQNGKKPSLLRALLSVFGWRIALLGAMRFLIEIIIRVPQPIFLGGLIAFYSTTGGDINTAYIYACGVVLSNILDVLTAHPNILAQLHSGMKLRVALCSMIYRKSLKLSKNSLGEMSAGQVVNLMSNDVGRLDQSILYLNYLWIGPTVMAIVTILMYREIGISALYGVAFLLALIPLQAWLGNKTSSLRLKTAQMTDERVSLMVEIIQGIQVIKMYAWEKPFGKLVDISRKREIKVIRYISYVRGVLQSFMLFNTRCSIFFSLVGFTLLGNLLTAEKAFVITAYYNLLRQTMTVLFPQGIGHVAEALVSIKRIQTFMLNEEKGNAAINEYMAGVDTTHENVINGNDKVIVNGGSKHTVDISMRENGLQVTNICARWKPNNTEYTLNEVNLQFQPQTLVAIIGPVGSGKSSLIQAILRELPLESGSININGEVSYASQEPWLFSGSVRTNILFGQPMDHKRYKEVCKNCALERDFDLLPFGDKTIVGERGQSLSGGQKARISLARACYRNAAIYLLDDPLSAVDTHVGKHLFDQCLRGLLKNKIVILATHQLQFLQKVDQIVIFKQGRVEAVGTYDALRKTGLDFAKLLADPNKEDKEEQRLSRSGSRLQNQISDSSTIELDTEDTDKNQMIMEEKHSGSIGWTMYKRYFNAGGGFFLFSAMFLFCLTAQISVSGGDYYLSYWVNNENDLDAITIKVSVDGLMEDRRFHIYVFSAIMAATIIITLCRSLFFYSLAMRASTKLHELMYEGVTKATMYFFNTTPSGRIINRFSKDLGLVDEILPFTMIDLIQIFFQMFGMVVVVATINYYFLIPVMIIGIIFYYLRDFYLKSSMDIKRIEATTRSPIYSHLGASLAGVSTIRAFGAEEILVKEFDNIQDLNSSVFYMYISTSRAFGYWLDMLCAIFIATVTFSFFVMDTESSGNVGLAITQAMGMTGLVQWGMRQSAELENAMTAVERVLEYQTVDPEDKLEAEGDKKPPQDWPKEGAVKFDKISLRYSNNTSTDYVLKELDFDIRPCEKIGIVGRTGAGKSSLINALFRLSYNEGSITIDGRNTSSMGLHDLRKKISIIPQEPVLFSGTMRYNLDPFDEYSDEKLWSALEEVKLKQAISELPHGLQSRISEGGGNFSVGQRQLVCLARAILRENRILVMDEATANVDPQTDALIQNTIRRKFADCTILTIAHRLNTVMDSDKVLVMDAGRVVEFDSPYQLLLNPNSVFYGMVKDMGQKTFDSLLNVAKLSESERKKKLI